MRAFGLCVCTVAAVFSLRPVSDLFREPKHAAVANAFIEASTNPPLKVVPAFASRAGATSAISSKPGSAIKPREAGHGSVSAASHTDGEEERILAIKKELKRLGLYDGPMTPVWGDDARKAARKITGVKSKPSQRLLAALRAASPASRRSSNEEVRRKLPEAPNAAPLAEGVVSDGYLPPSQMRQTAQERSLSAGRRAAGEAARSERAHRRKIETAVGLASGKRPSRNAPRSKRNMFATASFSWPGL